MEDSSASAIAAPAGRGRELALFGLAVGVVASVITGVILALAQLISWRDLPVLLLSGVSIFAALLSALRLPWILWLGTTVYLGHDGSLRVSTWRKQWRWDGASLSEICVRDSRNRSASVVAQRELFGWWEIDAVPCSGKSKRFTILLYAAEGQAASRSVAAWCQAHSVNFLSW